VVLDSSKVYTPSRSAKPLTEVRDVQLNVDRRSQKHQELSEKRAQRQARLEAERLAEEDRRKAEEELEVRELRRNLVSLLLPPPLLRIPRLGGLRVSLLRPCPVVSITACAFSHAAVTVGCAGDQGKAHSQHRVHREAIGSALQQAAH
jgi:hypothetical protein